MGEFEGWDYMKTNDAGDLCTVLDRVLMWCQCSLPETLSHKAVGVSE